jgi:hypothetical protein
MYEDNMIVETLDISSIFFLNMNKKYRLLVLSALMIITPALMPMSEAHASTNTGNNIAINSTVGQQNSSDTIARSSGNGYSEANGGNNVGGDLCVSPTQRISC